MPRAEEGVTEMLSEESILIGALVLFSVLGGGVIVIIYGTITKGRWGINLDTVACPRCRTPAPLARRPASRRQALWGGWTCEKCGAEIDKWGREIAAVGPHPLTAYRTEAEVRSALRKRLLVGAVVAFPLGMLLEFIVIAGRTPTSWIEVVVAASDSLVLVGLVTATAYLVFSRLLNRQLRDRKSQSSAHGR